MICGTKLPGLSRPVISCGPWVLVFGPTTDRVYFCVTLLAQSVMLVLYGSLIPFWWQEQATICVFFFLYLVSTVSLYLLASLSDPGILPSNETRLHLGKTFRDFDEIYISLVDQENRSQTIFHPNMTVELSNVGKICKTCRISRPPLSHHCKICGHCVSIYDHHCSFIGNCIGQRNFRIFIWWSWTACVGVVCQGVFSVFTIVAASRELKEHSKETFAIAIALSLCDMIALAFLAQVVLFQFEHLYAGHTVKMRKKLGQPSLALSCRDRIQRCRSHIVEFLWNYTPRPSLLSTDGIFKARLMVMTHQNIDVSELNRGKVILT
jgi:hypothetical protein